MTFLGDSSAFHPRAGRTLSEHIRRHTRQALLVSGAAIVSMSLLGGALGYWAAASLELPQMVGAAVGGSFLGLTVALGLATAVGSRIARAASAPAELVQFYFESAGAGTAGEQPELSSFRPAAQNVPDGPALDVFELAEQQRRRVSELRTAYRSEALQNRAKSQLLTTMSHELRTPLNAIQGYAMLLQEDAAAVGNSAAEKDLGRIQDAGQHLLSLLNTILEVSRLESGATNVDRFVIDIPSMVASVVEEFRRVSGSVADRLTVSIEDEVDVMFGDTARTGQCLLKLLDGACTSSSAGNVSLRVRLRKQAGMLRGVNFELTCDAPMTVDEGDQVGGGMSSATLSFSIADRLAKSMGGEFAMQQEGPNGGRVTLSLPLVPSAEADKSDAKSEVASDAAGSGDSSRGLALIIDDNSAAVDLMLRWFSKMDFDVLAATDGDEGLQIARERRPDVIFLDVYMPNRSGYDVLKELRSDPAIGATPVILVTVDGDRTKALKSGASDYIRKPAAEEQIRSVLEVYCSAAAGRILVIEDNDDAASLVARCAEQVGFSVSRASDGIEGVRMARAERPDAIVLDLGLPGQDGFQVMEKLRDDASLAQVPVIVMSARDISAEHYRMITNNGYRFFPKAGLSPRELAAQLKEIAA